jgi:hypothetical protein
MVATQGAAVPLELVVRKFSTSPFETLGGLPSVLRLSRPVETVTSAVDP